MDFDFPDEQHQLADTVSRCLGDLRPDQNPWAAISQLGIGGLAVDEEHEGFGGAATDLYLLCQTLGRRCVSSPLWGTSVVAKAIAWAGGRELKDEILPQVARGEVQLALACGEHGLRYDLSPSSVTGQYIDGGDKLQLSGEKAVVLFGAHASQWLVSVQIDGQTHLVLVPRTARGVSVTHYNTFDDTEAADLTFSAVVIPRLNILDGDVDGGSLLERVADYGAALLCAEAVGLMEAAKETTLEYLKTRQQFGKPLSEFQVIQHRMVDLLIQLEQARSISLLAVAHADSDDAFQRVRSVAAAKALTGKAGKLVAQSSVQLHGAIGLTQECIISRIHKRLTAIDLILGDTDHHLERLADLGRDRRGH